VHRGRGRVQRRLLVQRPRPPRRPAGPGAAPRWRRDDGVSTIEFVLLTPVLFFFVFASVQFALYFYARHVAVSAAQAGARVARAEAADRPQDFQRAAVAKVRSQVAQLGSGLLLDPRATATYRAGGALSQDVVRVEVDGDVPHIFPGLEFHVTVASEGPVEQFVPDGPR
jgi:Flp pilus assembly protein TadG